MQVLPIDLTALVSVIGGISIVLIPILGITARFALKPTVEALGRFMDRKGLDETLSLLERRMALMEQQIETVESSVRQLSEAADFQRQLANPGPTGETATRPT